MALEGSAAILIWTALDSALLAQHDHWHSTEHFPERMGVPGFLRGRRACAVDLRAVQQRFILYEIADIGIATSTPYLERLNNPTPWSRKIMTQCKLDRTLCRVAASHGKGVGAHLLAIRLSPQPARERELQAWIAGDLLPMLVQSPGVAGAHLLCRDGSVTRPPTNEEALRRGGSDTSADWVVVVEGYEPAALQRAAETELREARLAERGAAAGSVVARYTLSHLMTSRTP